MNAPWRRPAGDRQDPARGWDLWAGLFTAAVLVAGAAALALALAVAARPAMGARATSAVVSVTAPVFWFAALAGIAVFLLGAWQMGHDETQTHKDAETHERMNGDVR